MLSSRSYIRQDETLWDALESPPHPVTMSSLVSGRYFLWMCIVHLFYVSYRMSVSCSFLTGEDIEAWRKNYFLQGRLVSVMDPGCFMPYTLVSVLMRTLLWLVALFPEFINNQRCCPFIYTLTSGDIFRNITENTGLHCSILHTVGDKNVWIPRTREKHFNSSPCWVW